MREDELTYSSNRLMKDSVLRLLLDDEETLLQVFNALEGTNYKRKDAIRINTLKGPIFGNRKNDLSFSVEDWYLSLIEHQSTLTENIPLRMFIYMARVYEQILDMTKAYRASLYKIPLPRLYMLYNGTADFPQEALIRLSDAFLKAAGFPDMTPCLEVTVKVININADKHHPLLEKCSVLKEYSLFIARVREKLTAGKNRDIAVKESIRECIEEGILSDFLMKHGKEVFNMLFDEITYEDILRIRIEEAEELAIERGIEKTKRETALKLRQKKVPLETISECTGLSESQIQAL